MAITTLLAALVALQWGYHPLLVIAVNGFFILVDLVFFAANSTKLFEGGWFPLLLAAAVAFVMLTWRTGAKLVDAARAKMKRPEEEFLRMLVTNPPLRLPGTAAFFTQATAGIPLALGHHVKHNRVLHERVLLVSVLTTEAPRVASLERVRVVPVGGGVTRVVLQFGFMESPDVPDALQLALARPLLEDIDPGEITYYLRRETIMPTEGVPGMAVWREELFAMMHRNANRSAAYFCLPTAQVVEVGIEIEI